MLRDLVRWVTPKCFDGLTFGVEPNVAVVIDHLTADMARNAHDGLVAQRDSIKKASDGLPASFCCNLPANVKYSPSTTMNSSDELLMTAVREGDVQQLTLLFERYQKPLFDFFGRMNGTRAGSDDMVQDVFFRILKYRATFRNENRFRPWLYQIARNVRTDHSKSDFGPQDPRVSEAETFRSESPVYRLEQDEDAAILRCALGMLSDEKRELLVLVWYQEMKYQDIADLLGIDVGAVKVRVHRAVKELRRGFDRISNEKSSCNVKKFRII